MLKMIKKRESIQIYSIYEGGKHLVREASILACSACTSNCRPMMPPDMLDGDMSGDIAGQASTVIQRRLFTVAEATCRLVLSY